MTEAPLFLNYRGERLVQSTARKAASCWHCLRPIERGESTYRPLGNGMQRFRRLHAACGIAAGTVPAFLSPGTTHTAGQANPAP